MSSTAPRDTCKGVGVGRKAGSEAGEAVRWGHFRFGALPRRSVFRRAVRVGSNRLPIAQLMESPIDGCGKVPESFTHPCTQPKCQLQVKTCCESWPYVL